MPETLTGVSPWQDATRVKSYSTFSGADIIASINDKVFGNIQSITYAVQREIAPIYVMGSANLVAYARGKRAITGSLVFINFDRDALLAHMNSSAAGLVRLPPLEAIGGNKWGHEMLAEVLRLQATDTSWITAMGATFQYVDQIPPFDITISFINEFGNTGHMRIEGVQLINEGMGMSIDDVVLEKAVTFIARDLKPLVPNLMEVQP